MNIKRKGIWTVITLVLAVLTIWAVTKQGGNMSPGQLWHLIITADPLWMFLAVLFMLGMIAFEGEAVRTILRGIGYPKPFHRGFLYAGADQYFSAITPSASGGQPASAYFMIEDGVPTVLVTAVLVLNVMLYTSAVLALTGVSILMHPQLYMTFMIPSRILIVCGVLMLSGLTLFFYMLLHKQKILFVIASKVVSLLSHIRLVRHPERLLTKLSVAEHEYRQCVHIMRGKTRMIVKAFIFNVLQRLSQFLVTVTLYLATGGQLGKVKDLYVIQCMITLGSNCVPVPGGMGVTDYLMLDGFTTLFEHDYAYMLELLVRGLSFYVMTAVGAVTVIIGMVALRRRKWKKHKKIKG